MNIEENRLRTFENWENVEWIVGIPYSELAKSGFHATNHALEVQCHWCGLTISEWENVENIHDRHRELSSNCEFVLNPEETTNVLYFTLAELKSEQCRLSTFKNWPVAHITPASLAKAGFFYINISDQVKCAWCLGIIGQWEVGDNPFSEHLKFFATCPKVQASISTPETPYSNSGIQSVKTPRMTQYSSLDARLRTFSNWTMGNVQNPEILAQAGFYYLGIADEVRCFYCDGGLRFWLAEDDPWFEHARCFPKCQFVQLVKGQLYIENVLSQIEQNPNPNPNQQHQTDNQLPAMTLDEALSTEPVQLALQMGLNSGRVRAVTKTHLEATGHPFATSQALIEAVLDGQISSENVDSPSSSQINRRIEDEVTRLLWTAISSSSPVNSRSSSSSSSADNSESTLSTTSNNVPESKTAAYNYPTCEASENKLVNTKKLSLEEENKRLKDARECKICMADEVGVVFCPCGHLVSCVQCAPAITTCPLCRASIKGRVRTFLS